jgi:hypothetical protein
VLASGLLEMPEEDMVLRFADFLFNIKTLNNHKRMLLKKQAPFISCLPQA